MSHPPQTVYIVHVIQPVVYGGLTMNQSFVQIINQQPETSFCARRATMRLAIGDTCGINST